jgi:hypothetical protein
MHRRMSWKARMNNSLGCDAPNLPQVLAHCRSASVATRRSSGGDAGLTERCCDAHSVWELKRAGGGLDIRRTLLW